MIVCLVLEDLPVANSSGYCTYNAAFVEAATALGHEVHIVLTGPRFGQMVTNLRNTLAPLTDVRLHSVHGIIINDYLIARSAGAIIRAFPKAVNLANSLKSGISSGKTRGKKVQIGRFLTARDATLSQKLIEKISPDFIFVDTIFRTQAVPEKYLVKCALIAHDVFSERCTSLQNRGITPAPFVTQDEERKLVQKFRTVVAISEHDQKSLEMLTQRKNVSCLFSPIPDGEISRGFSQDPSLLYIGSNTPHNVDGLRWFFEYVWPMVNKACPGVRFNIVGTVCNSFHKDQIPRDVALHGRVDQFDQFCGGAVVAINPILAGSGLKIKMVDYFKNFLPCVTTSLGAQGFPDREHSPIVVADSPVEFAEAVVGLLSNPQSYDAHSQRCPAYCSHFFSSGFKQKLELMMAGSH